MDEEYEKLCRSFDENKGFLIINCYNTNNRFVYLYDLHENNPYKQKEVILHELKIINFVPTYEKWCLYCDNKDNITSKCSQCKTVYFCDKECQRKAWKIHKKHCGRNQLAYCSHCGIKDIKNLIVIILRNFSSKY